MSVKRKPICAVLLPKSCMQNVVYSSRLFYTVKFSRYSKYLRKYVRHYRFRGFNFVRRVVSINLKFKMKLIVSRGRAPSMTDKTREKKNAGK